MGLVDVELRLKECLARVPVPIDRLPLFGEWVEGRTTVDVDGSGFAFGGIEAARKSIVFRTSDEEELVYRVVKDTTWALAYDLLRSERPSLRDHRLFYFPHHVLLMAKVSEAWARRLFLELAQALHDRPIS